MEIETFETEEVDVLAADMLWQDETSKHEGNNKRKAESTIHFLSKVDIPHFLQIED